MAKGKQNGQGTPATVALTKAGVTFTTHTYEHDPAAKSYGLEAAEALGLQPEQVFKTLLVDVDGKLSVGVVPVDKQLDLKAVAAALNGKKATMADPAAAERITGYVVGGISPIGQKRLLPTVVDETATIHETVYVSGGRRRRRPRPIPHRPTQTHRRPHRPDRPLTPPTHLIIRPFLTLVACAQQGGVKRGRMIR